MNDTDNINLTDNFRSLKNIELEDYNIIVCKRDIKPLQKAVKTLIELGIQIRIEGSIQQILKQLTEEFKTVNTDCKAILNDIEVLLSQFKLVSKVDYFKLILSTVNSNMCSKFHTDNNTLRLLCTYAGPGTLWLPKTAVKSVKNPNEVNWEDEFSNEIQQAQIGEVVLLKGMLYPNGNAVMHKSPSIEEAGNKRLLLRIDTHDFLNF